MKILRSYICLHIFILSFYSNAQLAGNYTIGGLNPDFPTIDSAIKALAISVISDTVIFYIRPGSYSGTHSFTGNYSYPITFRGQSKNASDVILACDRVTTNNYSLKHVTLKPIVNVSFLAAKKGMEVRGYNLQIDSCIILGPSNLPNYNNGIWIRAHNGITTTSVLLSNLKFKNLDYGLVFSGVDYWGQDRYWGTYEISNSEFDSCITAIYHEGDVEDSLSIFKNTIKNSNVGIHLSGNDVGRTYIQSNNIINSSLYSINVDNVRTSTYRVSIFNNFISGGIRIYDLINSKQIHKKISINVDDCTGIDFINNSVNGGIRFISCSDVHIYNNNFSTDLSTPVSIVGVSNIIANNNNFYSDSTNYLLSNNGQLSILPPYFNGDTAFSFIPFYFSNTDLHSYSPHLQHLADPTLAPVFDIDGELRNSLPDVGADEYQSSDLFPFAWYEAYCEEDTLGRFFDNISVRADSSYWDFGDGTNSVLNSPSHSYNSYGDYLVSLTVSNDHGLSSYSDTVKIIQRAAETIQFNNDRLSISLAYQYYQWFLNGDALPGKNSWSIIPEKPGVYMVLYRDHDGCERYSSKAMWVGLNDIEMYETITINPNPNNGNFVVDLSQFKSFGNGQIQVFNSIGALIYQEKILEKERVDISLPQSIVEGLYYIRFTSESANTSRNFILRR